ncbi:MAG: hypothetical protein JWN76_2812 [Chitinophagaceae bacterium]|nr:hypothetical protein [Chitinophagaceae bacterium]
MKNFLIISALIATGFFAQAQGQELQQLKLDIEKLAQLKAMLSEMKQGYQVLQQGYNKIASTSKDNFDLHKSFLDEQLKPGAVVKNNAAVNKILSDQLLIVSECKTAFKGFQRSGLFAINELAEMKVSGDVIVENINAEVERLKIVLQQGSVRMTDAERLVEIDRINAEVIMQAEQLRAMNRRNENILAWRTQQKKDIDALRKLNGM